MKLSELSYEGNMGIVEMFQFYRVATKEQKARMEKVIKSNSWDEYKKLIYETLGVQLV